MSLEQAKEYLDSSNCLVFYDFYFVAFKNKIALFEWLEGLTENDCLQTEPC